MQMTYSMKHLGVHVDDKLSWNVHLNHINNKIAKTIGILCRVKYSLAKDIQIILVLLHPCPYIFSVLHSCMGAGNKDNTEIFISDIGKSNKRY